MSTLSKETTDSRDLATIADSGSRITAANEAINKRVCVWRGDITRLKCDMIVNAANKTLLGGGGVDGTIHRRAGPSLLAECTNLGGCETGQTKVTSGYNLPARRIAHTVGPIYSADKAEESAELLASCYRTSLEACAAIDGGSIAFPSVSTGIYGYPIEDATHVAMKTVRKYLEADQDRKIKRVIFTVFSESDEKVYDKLAKEYFPL